VFEEPAAAWIDVGLCSPQIPLNLSGSRSDEWMGDQVDQATRRPLAWIYRASGLFRAANSTHSPGSAYGRSFGAGSNVSVTRHSSMSLEFFLDGTSQGLISLAAADAVPMDAVGCIGPPGVSSFAVRFD
jgi:hypothetical protein